MLWRDSFTRPIGSLRTDLFRGTSIGLLIGFLAAAMITALIVGLILGSMLNALARPALAATPRDGAVQEIPVQEASQAVARENRMPRASPDGPTPATRALPDQQDREGPNAVQVRAVIARSIVRPGDQVPIAVVFDHPDGYHSWPHDPEVPPQFEGLQPIATDIQVERLSAGLGTSDIQWPVGEYVEVDYTDSGRPIDLLSYVGEAIAYVPLDVDADAPLGPGEVALEVRWQSCDDLICYFPKTEILTLALEVAAADAPVSVQANEPELFAGFGIEGFRAAARPASRIPAYINVFGYDLSFNPTGAGGLALLLALAAFGGLLLNFTPCVLPIIPIKIMGLSAASSNPTRMKVLGIAMTAGVTAFWLAIGSAIAFVSGFSAISSLFQTGWFAPLVGAFVGLMGFGMIGLFSVRLPALVYKIDPSQDTVSGSFGFGVMTAVLSTPCTAPFMAGASAWAALQPPPYTLITFGAIGVGMALPYLALTLNPGLVSRIPRTGPASELIKQVMGLLMLAVAAFFIGSAVSAWLQTPPEPAGRLYWWAVTFFVVAACAWLFYGTTRIAGSRARRWTVQGASLAAALIAISLARSLSSQGPIDWVYYTPDRFAASMESGDVIVLDFTAEWCLNCKVLERGVLHRDRIVELFAEPAVVPMRIDLTSENPDGQEKLEELRWIGIPLLAVYGPGVGYGDPVRFDSYTAGMVEDAVDEARGEAISRR